MITNRAIRFPSPRPDHMSFVLPSESLRALVLRAYVRRGWKYFVTWKDVNGFGIQGCRRAVWQGDSSPVSIR